MLAGTVTADFDINPDAGTTSELTLRDGRAFISEMNFSNDFFSLGVLDDACSHVLLTANGGYEFQLPPGGTAAPIAIEGSDPASAVLPIPGTRVSTAMNPLPPGSSGFITINRVADE